MIFLTTNSPNFVQKVTC